MSDLSDAIGGEYEYDGSARQEFTALPPGNYLAMATKAQVKDTKDGTGKYLSVQFQILDGEHARRIVFANYNIKNKSPQATQIGLRQLGQLWEAAGLGRIVRDENDLLDKSVTLRIALRKDDPTQNEVVSASPAGESAPPAPAPAPARVPPPWPPATATAPAAPAAGKKLPWQK
jgi:hypothetical protein